MGTKIVLLMIILCFLFASPIFAETILHTTETYSLELPEGWTTKHISSQSHEMQYLDEQQRPVLIIRFKNMAKNRSDKEYLASYDNPVIMLAFIKGLELSSGMRVVNKQKINFNNIPSWEFTAKPKSDTSSFVLKTILFYKNGKEFSIVFADIDSHRKLIKETLETLRILK